MYRKDLWWLYGFGILLLLITGYLIWSYEQPEWKAYQEEFRGLIAEKFGAERAAQIPSGLQQIWLPDLHRVDRCTTCHQGMEWKGIENEPNPYRSHPREILQNHPIEKFGCVPCHGGQGYATDMASAHGTVEHWEEPLLGKELADLYLVRDKKALMEMNCNACHR